jgi:hypothetical protein
MFLHGSLSLKIGDRSFSTSASDAVRKPETIMVYLWSDAWLLQAIILAAGDGLATLGQVFASADSANHTLPTPDELHGALSRLTAARLIEEVDSQFRLTDAVAAEIRSRVISSGWKEGRRVTSLFLHAEPWTGATNVRDQRNKVRYPGLTDARIRDAEREYRNQFSRQIRTST